MRGVLELVLEVDDLERSVAFYRDVCGMPEITRWPASRPGVWLRMGPNEVLGLWPPRSGGPGIAVHGSRGGRHVHFAIYVERGSLDAWLSKLAGAGLDVEGPVDFEHGRSLFVTDPDGNVVELGDWPLDWEGRPVAKTASQQSA